MAMTLRLPPELAARGRRYAAEVGLSLNGLVAVALRDYLDPRTRVVHSAPPPPVHALARALARQVQAGPVRRRR